MARIKSLAKDMALEQSGICRANSRIAVVMPTQVFRYAYDSFIFAQSKGENKQTTYALVIKFFIIMDSLIFLGVIFYLDIIRSFINRAGVKAVMAGYNSVSSVWNTLNKHLIDHIEKRMPRASS